MVDKIHSYIFENYYDLDASDLLQIIEDAGMLPPRWVPIADSTEMGNGGMFNADNDNYPKGHYNVANGKSIYCGVINSWEPEDEIKACSFCENPCGNDHCPVANENKKDN